MSCPHHREAILKTQNLALGQGLKSFVLQITHFCISTSLKLRF